jgi:hypothetical protein
MPKKPVAVSLRKPQPPADIDAFVSGESGSAPPRAIAAANRADSQPVVHGEREYREMTLYLPSDVARKLSFYCMDMNCDMNRVVAEAVAKHVTPEATRPSAHAERVSFDLKTLELLVERSRKTFERLLTRRRWAF